MDSSVFCSSYRAVAQKASQAGNFFIIMFVKAETCLLRIHIPEGPSLEQKQQLSQVFTCTAAVCMTVPVTARFHRCCFKAHRA